MLAVVRRNECARHGIHNFSTRYGRKNVTKTWFAALDWSRKFNRECSPELLQAMKRSSSSRFPEPCNRSGGVRVGEARFVWVVRPLHLIGLAKRGPMYRAPGLMS